VIARIEPWCRSKGITCDGRAGDSGVFTHYVGSANSERRIRMYRKDLQDDGVLFQFGPTLRVEVVLKGDHAKAAWVQYENDADSLARVCAGHVEQMTGHAVQSESLEPMPLVLPEVELSSSLFALMKQHGSTLAACASVGIDVQTLARAAADASSDRSQCAWRRRVEGWRALDVDAVVSMVLDRLAGNNRIRREVVA
jgi:hypothetical protein